MHSSGFTLIETLVVVAIMGILATMATLMSVQTYRGYVGRSERDTVLALLEEARSHAQNNFYQSSHGVCADTLAAKFVVFAGVYVAGVPTNQLVDMSPRVYASSTPPTFMCTYGGVRFAQLSATTSSTTIYIGQNNSTTSISIKYEGTLNW